MPEMAICVFGALFSCNWEKREGGRGEEGGGRSPFFEEGLTRFGCCSLVSEKAVDDSADLAFPVACRIFTFPPVNGHRA